jgi:DNA-binding IclR family transcriptional regulator
MNRPTGSQTLSRGIQVLEIVSAAEHPISIESVSSAMGLHRSVVYRLVRTLEDHKLLDRTPRGDLTLGAGIAALASGVERDLHSAALPELTAVAEQSGFTCFLALRNQDECITLVSVEPRNAVASVVQRPGSRHSLLLGAPGKAILSSLSESEWPELASSTLRQDIQDSRGRGYFTSSDEVIKGVHAVAAPVITPGHPEAAIAILRLEADSNTDALGRTLIDAAERIRRGLSVGAKA